MSNPTAVIDDGIKTIKSINETANSITKYASDLNINKKSVPKTKTTTTISKANNVDTKHITDANHMLGAVVLGMLFLFVFCLIILKNKTLSKELEDAKKDKSDSDNLLLDQKLLNVEQQKINSVKVKIIDEQIESAQRIEAKYTRSMQDQREEIHRLQNLLFDKTQEEHQTTLELITVTQQLKEATKEIAKLNGNINTYKEIIDELELKLKELTKSAEKLAEELEELRSTK